MGIELTTSRFTVTPRAAAPRLALMKNIIKFSSSCWHQQEQKVNKNKDKKKNILDKKILKSLEVFYEKKTFCHIIIVSIANGIHRIHNNSHIHNHNNTQNTNLPTNSHQFPYILQLQCLSVSQKKEFQYRKRTSDCQTKVLFDLNVWKKFRVIELVEIKRWRRRRQQNGDAG